MSENKTKPCAINSSNNDEFQALKSLYEMSIKSRDFEIGQLIQRNNFFMLFQGVLLASALQSSASKPFVETIICLSGIFVSWYQLQMAAGAKFWQEWWESRVDHFEGLLSQITEKEEARHFHKLYAVSFNEVHDHIRSRLTRDHRVSLTNFIILRGFSVGRVPLKVSMVLLSAWFFLFLGTIDFHGISNISSTISGFHVQKSE